MRVGSAWRLDMSIAWRAQLCVQRTILASVVAPKTARKDLRHCVLICSVEDSSALKAISAMLILHMFSKKDVPSECRI